MTVEIRVPQLPESVADATLVAWRKQPGDAVSRDENLADLETDKVVLEVPAPVAGILQEIRAAGGQHGQERRPARGLETGAASAQAQPRGLEHRARRGRRNRAQRSASAAPKLGPAAQARGR